MPERLDEILEKADRYDELVRENQELRVHYQQHYKDWEEAALKSEAILNRRIEKLERRLKRKAEHERELLALFEMQSEAMARQTDHQTWQHYKIRELEETVAYKNRQLADYKRRCKTAYDNLATAFDEKRISKKALDEALIELVEF